MKLNLNYYQVLAAALCAGCLVHPASSAVGLLIISAAHLAERYLTSNIADKDRQDIQSIRADLAKIKTKQESLDLSKAFGPR